ncbi:MAG: hypothetical protein H0W12_07025 [Chitinophagaceae bacterium]|nr:hypothetical protein [Chitinophagaceae bacterium]
MKRILILATAALLVSGATYAHDGGKKKAKNKTCKKVSGCCKDKDKEKTAKM